MFIGWVQNGAAALEIPTGFLRNDMIGSLHVFST